MLTNRLEKKLPQLSTWGLVQKEGKGRGNFSFKVALRGLRIAPLQASADALPGQGRVAPQGKRLRGSAWLPFGQPPSKSASPTIRSYGRHITPAPSERRQGGLKTARRFCRLLSLGSQKRRTPPDVSSLSASGKREVSRSTSRLVLRTLRRLSDNSAIIGPCPCLTPSLRPSGLHKRHYVNFPCFAPPKASPLSASAFRFACPPTAIEGCAFGDLFRFGLFGLLSLLKALRSIHPARPLRSQSGGFSPLCGLPLAPLVASTRPPLKGLPLRNIIGVDTGIVYP